MADLEFTTETCAHPRDREDSGFDMLNLMPDGNLALDGSHDYERFLRSFDEVLQLLLCDVDAFTQLGDVDLIPAQNLDAMLVHLGVPFSFARDLAEADKRRLASILVDIYRRKGVEAAIEATVNFLLSCEIDVQPFLDPMTTWTLGLAELGITTFLGPGTSFLRFSFQVVVQQDLDETTRRRMIEVVSYMKPAWTHFVRVIEPSTPNIPVFVPE